LRNEAKPITLEEIKDLDSCAGLRKHSLGSTFWILRLVMVSKSKEAIEREVERNQILARAKLSRKTVSPAQDEAPSGDDVQSPSTPRLPSTLPSTPQKRSLSGTTNGTRSTGSTPTKLVKPEKDIQWLQDTLAADVIMAIFERPYIPVTWARGRKMNLIYEPLSPLSNPLTLDRAKPTLSVVFLTIKLWMNLIMLKRKRMAV